MVWIRLVEYCLYILFLLCILQYPFEYKLVFTVNVFIESTNRVRPQTSIRYIYLNNYHVSAWGYEMLLSPCDVRFMLVLFCLSYYWNIKKRYFNRHFCYASYHTQRVYFYYKLFVIRYKDWQKQNIKSQPLFKKRQIIWIFHKWKCAKHLEFHSLRVIIVCYNRVLQLDYLYCK